MASRLPLAGVLGLLGLLPLSPEAMAEAEADAPDLALLEFLGGWEDPDGEWIDPLQILDEMDAEGAKDAQGRQATPRPAEEDDHD